MGRRGQADGWGRVASPQALDRKHPSASTDWRRQWVFPQANRRRNIRTGEEGRPPLNGKPARAVDADNARELVFEAYRIFFDVGDAVEILTVRRGSELIDVDERRAGPA